MANSDATSFSDKNTHYFEKKTADTQLATVVMKTGSLLSSNNTTDAAINMARSALLTQANTSIQQWLKQFGTARVQFNVNDHFHLKGSALDLLLPLYDSPQSMLFTQLGARNKDSRNTVNIGMGMRTWQDHWLFGMNTFFDQDVTNKNRRLGIGAEIWTDHLKLSANHYVAITDWHSSADFTDYNERPANGYDISAEVYLPFYPQLGGKLLFEQYQGNDVDLWGKSQRQRDPYAISIGINYTPIPLITLGAEHREGKGNKSDTRFNLQINYRIGQPWQTQINPTTVATIRSLAGSRYDLVERNNHIVLEHQKQSLISLTLPKKITGMAKSKQSLTALVTTKYGLGRIEWNSAALQAAGGMVRSVSPVALEITMPPYQPGSNNVYNLSSVAYDNKGNTSTPVIVQLMVTPQNVSGQHSQTWASSDALIADGQSTSHIYINLRDDNNQPIEGMANQLILTPRFTATENPENGETLPGSPIKLSDIKESKPGKYTTILTAGTQPGTIELTPSLNKNILQPYTVNLMKVHKINKIAKFDFIVSKNKITADNNDESVLIFTAKDADNKPLNGLPVSFEVSDAADTTLSKVTEQDGGIYTATLKGSIAKEVTIEPRIDGNSIAAIPPKAVTLIQKKVEGESPDTSSFVVSKPKILADGNDETVLTFTAKDADNKPLSGLPVSFKVSDAADTILSKVTEQNGGVYIATLKGSTAKEVTIEPLIAGKSIGETPKKLILTAKKVKVDEVSPDKSSFVVSKPKILADGNDETVLTFTAKDASNKPLSELNVSFNVADTDITISKITPQDGGIYTATLKGSAAKEVAVALHIDSKPVAGIPSPRVTLKRQLIFTKVRVNGAEFGVDQGFPQTGFEGAHFQLLVNGTEANNKDYDWSSSDQNISVDQNGRVTMVSPLDAYSPTVSITAKDRDIQNNMQSYTFTLRAWWINSGLEKVLYSQANTTCDNGGDGFELDFASYITNATETEKRNATRAVNGKLWSEWGSMSHYGHGWQSDNYWIRDDGLSVHLGNGHIVETPNSPTRTGYGVCSKYY
ncbi:inverse autotransporter beta domain-containing protein [Candidatus Regiella insecticola]|nr:inverse autotransporter beta domain-containing protein [Candidatus Regiella insecticola]